MTIAALLLLEAAVTATLGALLGIAMLYAALVVAQPMIDATYGLYLPIDPPTAREYLTLAAVVAASAIVSLIPALRAYRLSLSDGMMVKT